MVGPVLIGKRIYETPTSEVLVMHTTGIVCTSGETDGGVSNYNKQAGLTW